MADGGPSARTACEAGEPALAAAGNGDGLLVRLSTSEASVGPTAYELFATACGPSGGEELLPYFRGQVGRPEEDRAAFDQRNPETWSRVGRNAPCPCGSGRKFKRCHGTLA